MNFIGIERGRRKLPSLAFEERKRLINPRRQGGDFEILGSGRGGNSEMARASDGVK